MSDVNEELESSPSEEVDESPKEEVEETPEEELKLDRPAGNFVKELARKNSDQMQEFMQSMPALVAEIMQSTQKSPEPAQQKTGFYAHSIGDLEQHAAGLEATDPNRQTILDHVQERKITDAVQKQVATFTTEQKMANARTEWGNKATNKYPELNDPSSDFFKQTDKELKSMEQSVVAVNPRAVYDAANAVAQSLDVKPAQRRTVTKPGATKSAAKPAEKVEGAELSEADIKAAGAGLEHVLPKGKKFDPKAIRERAKHYKTNLSHHLK